MKQTDLKNGAAGRSRRSLQRILRHRLMAIDSFFTPQRCRSAAFVFFLLMVVIGAIPGEAQALSDAVGDKLLHLCAYSFLTCALFCGMPSSNDNRAWATVLLVGLLGGVDEAIQSFMPYRSASMTDWIFDMLAGGLTLAVLVAISNGKREMRLRQNRRVIRPAQRPN
jgi:VanZ family protein